MQETFTAEASTVVNAPPARVWEALVDPALIKQYFFGSDIVTDWKEGNPILYKGMWEGKPFEDKGRVVKVEPERLLVVTHWSPLSGVPDTPENYHTVTYQLAPENAGTRVTILQDNNATEEEMEHSAQNWRMVLEGLKRLVEGDSSNG